MKRSASLAALAASLFAFSAANAADGSGAHMKKLGPALEYCYAEAMSGDQPQNELFVANMTADGYVKIDAIASNSSDDLAATIASLGGRSIVAHGRVVSAELSPTQLADLAASDHLAFAQPTIVSTDAGLVASQGDRAMRTDVVRALKGLDGTGMTIGILSDSFSCSTANGVPDNEGNIVFTTTEEDIASGDLPAAEDINILLDFEGNCIDEGRAMAQLIHDVVPGAKIAYHTAFGGQATFADGIVRLAVEAGADVIVDDVIYFAEPMFQDGIIAQAADEVNRLGVPYYSSNGNRGRDAFESEYRAVDDGTGAIFHDFDPTSGVDTLNEVTLNGALQTNLTFQWDNPNFSVSGAPGAQTDVDVIMFDEGGNRVPDCFDFLDENGFFPLLCQFQFTDGGIPIDGGNGGDAIELVSLVDFIGGRTVSIGFETQSGPAPSFVKFVVFGGGFTNAQYAIDAPSGFGHNNAAGAEGVGASAFSYTEEFIGDPQTLQIRANAGLSECVPACLNDFSSAGGTPIFFDVEGNRLPEREVRFKPGVTGPDGTNTTFFRGDTIRDDDDGDGVFETGEPGEFQNFFGTSAAAPHAAALALQMLDSEKSEILTRNGKFRMCRPDDDDDSSDDEGEGGRDDGDTRRVNPDQVQARIDQGWLLGPCHRSEPARVRNVMRSTAQDMSERISLSIGNPETIQIFDEVGPLGFDFDSGFGFIDAVAAIEKFTDDDDSSDDDSSDDDSSD